MVNFEVKGQGTLDLEAWRRHH